MVDSTVELVVGHREISEVSLNVGDSCIRIAHDLLRHEIKLVAIFLQPAPAKVRCTRLVGELVERRVGLLEMKPREVALLRIAMTCDSTYIPWKASQKMLVSR